MGLGVPRRRARSTFNTIQHFTFSMSVNSFLVPQSPVYELKAPGLDGVPKKFEKPWFMVTLMFLGYVK